MASCVSRSSKRAMSRDTSSRVMFSPIFATSSLSKDVEWMVNGGAALPNELTMRTRFGEAANKPWTTRRETPMTNELNTPFRETGPPAQKVHFTDAGFYAAHVLPI